MSEIEEKVIETIRLRAKVGAFKYGTTMERDDLTAIEWLRHLQEELLDGAIYVEKVIEVLSELITATIEGRNKMVAVTNELAQLALESVEREKQLARLEAEVEALRSLSRSQEGDGTEKTKA